MSQSSQDEKSLSYFGLQKSGENEPAHQRLPAMIDAVNLYDFFYNYPSSREGLKQRQHVKLQNQKI